MSSRSPSKPSASFTSWKLNIQEAALSDPRIKPGELRMFIYVLHNTSEDTRLAFVTDEAIMDDVPGHKEQSTCYRTRSKLAELGWWRYEPGRGTRQTVYAVQDSNVAAVMVKVKADRARRKADAQARRNELVAGCNSEGINAGRPPPVDGRRKFICDLPSTVTVVTIAGLKLPC